MSSNLGHNKLQVRIKELEQELRQSEASIATLKETNTSLEKVIVSLESKIEESIKDSLQLGIERARADKFEDMYNDTLIRLIAIQSVVNTKEAEINAMRLDLEDQLKHKDTQIKCIESRSEVKYISIKSTCNELRELCERRSRECDELKDKCSRYENSISDRESVISTLNDLIYKRNNEITRLRNSIENINSVIKRH